MVWFIRKYRIFQNIALLCLLTSCASMSPPKVEFSVNFGVYDHYTAPFYMRTSLGRRCYADFDIMVRYPHCYW